MSSKKKETRPGLLRNFHEPVPDFDRQISLLSQQ
jgi:hypothetical protein